MTNILVFGTGSIGSVYTCILSRGGASVTCVCRSNYEVVKSDGLKVVSTIFGELRSRPKVVQSVDETGGSYHFVLVCVKATPQSTSAAIEALRKAVTPGLTSIVLVQNGLGVERVYHEAFPDAAVISGVAYLPTTQIGDNVFSHSEMERLVLGLSIPEGQPTSTGQTQLDEFADVMRKGGATVVVSPDIEAERWTKVLGNGAISPICALSRCRDRQLIQVSRLATSLLKGVMLEIASVAAAAGYGHVITLEAVDKQLAKSLDRPLPGVQPSMMADALASRPMEVQAILGEIVRIAEQHRLDIPRVSTLFVLLEGLDFALQNEKQGPNQ